MTDISDAKEITDITFDFEGAHMALTHKTQGFSANKKPQPLLIKSEEVELTKEAQEAIEKIAVNTEKEVKIETSMFDFLRKYMGMYWDEADALARLLGYTGDGFEPTEYVDRTVEAVSLLKANKDIPTVAKAHQVEELKVFMDKYGNLFKDSSSEGNSDMNDVINKDNSIKPSDEEIKSQGVLMAKEHEEKIEKTADDVAALTEKLEALEKAAEEEKAEKEALASKVEAFEKAAQERLEKAFEAKVQTYSFVTEEEREEVAKTLIALDNETVIEMLDKAQAAIDAMGEAQGAEASDDIEINKSSGVKDKIMAQFGLEA
jgi:hypothetical protein